MNARSRVVVAAVCATLVLAVVGAAPVGAQTRRSPINATQARPLRGMHSNAVPSTNYGAGYFSYPSTGNVASASVTFTMPTFSCHSQKDSEWLSPGIWIYDSSAALSQFSGVEFNCNGGVLFQGDVICIDSYSACDDSLAVNPGDQVVAQLSESSLQTTAWVHDLTTGQKVGLSGAAVSNDDTVFLGDEGPSVVSGGAVTHVPTFSKVVFTKAQVNGFYLSDWSPTRYNLKTNSVPQDKAGPLTHVGDGFTTTFAHN